MKNMIINCLKDFALFFAGSLTIFGILWAGQGDGWWAVAAFMIAFGLIGAGGRFE